MAKKKKPIMIAVIALLVLGAGYKFAYPMLTGSKEATAAVATPLPGDPGPVLAMEERVLNVITPSDTPRYAKLGISIEFKAIDATFSALKGEALLAFEEEFAGEFAAYKAALDDSVVTIVSAKTFEELNTAPGKEKLRGELKAAFAEILGEEHEIINVYFTRFVTQ